MSLYATRRAEEVAQAIHFEQHQHCPGFDRNRYHPLMDYRCPHCEGNTTPPLPSQWDAMERAQQVEPPPKEEEPC